MATSRLQTISRHIQPQAIYTPSSQRTFTTTSNMSSPNNNNDFKLSELFNVKDKVVVVSGQRLILSTTLREFVPDFSM